MITFCVLASGSKANCIYIASDEVRVLVDCGLSAREAAKRLSSIGVEADSISAVLVTHEHEDHVRGVRVFSTRHNTQLFFNQGTLSNLKTRDQLDPSRVQTFSTGVRFVLGNLEFDPFSVMHDAADPVGFRVESKQASLVVVTDLGQVTTLLRQRLRNLDALILESNHDPKLLQEAPYPWELKQRISSRKGHLSNETAGGLIEELSSEEPGRLQVAVAAHISENSNVSELALEGFRNSWRRGGSKRQVRFAAASVASPTEVYTIGGKTEG